MLSIVDTFIVPTATCRKWFHLSPTLILTTSTDIVTELVDENLRHFISVAQEEGRRLGGDHDDFYKDMSILTHDVSCMRIRRIHRRHFVRNGGTEPKLHDDP